MKIFERSLLFALGFALSGTDSPAIESRSISTSEELVAAFTEPLDSVTISINPGTYHLKPTYRMEPTCGNCQDPEQDVFMSTGLEIRGRRVRITGPTDRGAVIFTRAGYGLYFTDCEDCSVENLSITGGVRDPDPNATDAAIVVKRSSVLIQNCEIRDNIGDSALVARNIVGIMGICGREGSRTTIRDNRIIRNSWDGIALYRDAEATITRNVIDGVDKAPSKAAGGGRGVGIGVTWNARAHIERNLVRRYWKGIGLFVDAEGTVKKNVVEDILTWGMALWDADKGKPVGKFEENVIFRTGACGVAITRSQPGDEPGHFRKNIIVATGRDPRYDSPDLYCYQCAIAKHAAPDNFEIEENLCFNNRRATDDLPDDDIPEMEFRKAIEPYCTELATIDVFKESEFIGQFCADLQRFNLFEHLFREEPKEDEPK